jgi:chemotaxis protein MotB
VRNRVRHESEGSYLASISDLMAGVLFLFIAIIVVFAFNLRVREDAASTAEQDLRRQALGPKESRDALLKGLETALRDRGVSVMIDSDHGVLRLPEDSVTFPQGTDHPTPTSRDNLTVLALTMRDLLPCYSAARSSRIDCSGSESHSTLDAVLVEGHTDRKPVIGLARFRDNWELSAARAIRTYHFLIETAPELDGLANARGEKLLSVSGYADSRPADTSDSVDADGHNRRIDIRFIMAPPAPNLEPKAAIEKSLVGAP